MPDDELLTLAEQGKLHDDRVLAGQVKRMLADPRAESLATNFGVQWLQARKVAEIVPDPVLRGQFILDALLGTPPATPPANVPAFPENQEGAAPRTVRERLEQHRVNPTCKACHGVMDPLGLALENFDAVGEWRTKDRETATAIDSSGELADGTVVHGPVELRNALLARREQFVQTLTEKLMTYALCRSIDYHDMPAVRRVVHEAARNVGVGAEIAARLADEGLLTLLAPIRRITGYDAVVPLAKLEHHYMPQTERIVGAVRDVLEAA